MAGGKKKQPKKALEERVVKFAKEYVQLAEALQREGVPEDVAREEARIAATSLLMEQQAHEREAYDPALGPCPTCGRG